MSVLAARDLTVAARLDGAVVPVLQRLNFTVAPGEVFGLVGESGAGKSMVGRAVARMLPDGFFVGGGGLEFAGRDLVSMPAAAHRALLGKDIAFIPQEPLTALNPVLTIGRQLDEHLSRLGLRSGRARRERALELCDAVHLPRWRDLLRAYPHQISGGMCQRILIAMAFAGDPRLVIADEPTTALDVTLQARIVRLVAAMQKRAGTAVVFITHDLRLAAQICDDVLVLYAGRVAEHGPARTLLAAPAHPYTRCLQLAAPPSGGERRALQTLPDQMPGLRSYNSIAGCAFAPRCPLAIVDCTRAPPPLADVAPDHAAACIRAAEAGNIAAPAAARTGEAGAGAVVLDVAGLSKTFSNGFGLSRRSTVAAVRDVSFNLREGEFLGVVGESGSGKTTLARLLVALERPSAGTIAIAGREVVHNVAEKPAELWRSVQMVFQDPQSALNPRRRAASIVTQPLEAAGASRETRLARAATLFAQMGLPAECALRLPSQLSGGQRQRVNIARALCATPKILIADEIVSGLDVSVQAQLLNLLLGLRGERSFSMVFISHDLSVVRYLCDRVLVMYRGNVVESGRTADVFNSPSHSYTRSLLAAAPPDDPAAVWKPVAENSDA